MDPVTETTENSVSVDDIQSQVDSLMLAVFEAMRCDGSTNGASADDSSSTILAKYKGLIDSIDNIVGIHRTQVNQEEDIKSLSGELAHSRQRILDLEAKLKEVSGEIDDRLRKVL